MGKLIMWIVLLIVGFILLVKGADWFVDGAAGIAEKCKIPALVIGLTVVAFGTSAPELAVSVTSAIKHSTDIAIGNVVGSNIVNILLILGLAALFHALPVQKSSLRLDLPVLVLASGLLVLLGALGGALQWWDGLILLGVFAVYMTLLLHGAIKEQKTLLKEVPQGTLEEQSEEKAEQPTGGKIAVWYAGMKKHVWFLIVLTLIGLAMVVGGGTLLVDGAQYIAEYFGVPQRVIGLTVVAIGTSLPELVTSVVAAKKGETDIAVGNVIGSNLFNILLVAGTSSLFYPLTFSISGNLVDALVALAAVLLLLILALIGKKQLGKVAGAIMLASFVGYYVYLFLATL